MKIQDYEQDIAKLKSMLEIYETSTTLSGMFWIEMTALIEEQINHCETCIKNLKK